MAQTTLAERTNQIDQYLNRQMKKAGTQVKAIDFFTSIITLVAGFFAALFLLALIDAWVLELSPVLRWACLFGLLAGAAVYSTTVILPLIIRRINPAYAAKVVESGQDSMKNSLINYVLLRKEGHVVSHRVIDAVGSQAANDISGIHVENSIDKSHTLKMALVLLGLVCLFGAYKILSPKDPFQTFARVLAPAADLSKPARVAISNVNPGNTSVYFGQQIPVSADISGNHNASDVRVVFSTDDGQMMDATIPMTAVDRSGRYEGVLKTGSNGVEQALKYQVVAGDGRSNLYTVHLKSTPTLTVESIQYDPPEYTRIPPRIIEGTSEIEAIEGTRVSLTAIANTQIQTAYLELLMSAKDGEYRVVNTVSMKLSEDQRPQCQFVLNLDNNRQQQTYSHYRLRFVTSDGQRNVPIAVYPIRIIPDLAPEIQIVDPTDSEVSVPENSRVRFQLKTSDPDFEISAVEVIVEHDGSRVFRERLPLGDQDPALQIGANFDMWPKKMLLKSGDKALVAFAAFDNRQSTFSQAPDPNVSLTRNIVVNIVEPIGNPPQDDSESTKESDNENANQDQNGERSSDQGEVNDQANDKSSADKNKSSDDQQAKSDNGGNDPSDKSSDKSGGDQKQSNEPQPSPADDPSKKKSDGRSDESQDQAGDPQASGNQSASGSEASGQKSASQGSGGKSDENNDSKKSDGDQDMQSGGDANRSDQTEQSGSGQPSGQRSQDSSGDPQGNQEGARQGGQPTGGNEQPMMGDDAHDGEIMERVRQFQEKQQQNSSGQSGQSDGSQQSPSGDQTAGMSDSGESNQPTSSQSGSDSSQSGSQGSQSDGQQPSSAGQSGSEQSGSEQSGGQQSGGQQSSGEQQSGGQQQSSGEQQSSGQQSGDEKSESQQSAGSQSADNGMDSPPGESSKDAQNAGQASEGNQGGQPQQQQDGGGGGSQSQSGEQSQQNKDSSQSEQSSGGGGSEQEKEQSKQSSGQSGGQQSEKSEQQQSQSGGGGQSEEKPAGGGGDKEGSGGNQSGSESGSGGDQGSGDQGSGGEGSGSQKSSKSGAGEQSGSQTDGQSSQEGASQQGSQQQQSSGQGSGQGSGQSGAKSNPPPSSSQPSETKQSPSGQSSNQQSQSGGQSSQSGSTGNQPGSQSPSQSGSPGSSNSQTGQSNSQNPSSDSQGTGGSQPGNGSSAGSSSVSDAGGDVAPGGGDSVADKANLEYAKETTDMVLDYLENQQISPDSKLLDELNWSEDDLRDFLKRWRELKQKANSGGAAEREKFNRTLQSLGLKPASNQRQSSDLKRDGQSGYRESGRVTRPPASISEKFRDFQKRQNRARNNR